MDCLNFMMNVNSFVNESKTIYLETNIETSIACIFGRSFATTEELASDLQDQMERFNKQLEEIKDYPDWHDKVQTEAGYYLHLLYNQHCHNVGDQSAFEKLDIHAFFK